jgi:hypothetical protein
MRGEIVKHKITKRKRLRSIKLNPELHQAMQRQLQAFRDKFGRDPEPADPVFFDDDADSCTDQFEFSSETDSRRHE